MRKIVLFSGTTEGRRLSGMLSTAGIAHVVCVATEAGAELMQEPGGDSGTTLETRGGAGAVTGATPETCAGAGLADIHVGRMDAAGMTAFLSGKQITKGDFVIDATHPYATEVTENIKEAVAGTGAEYLRVIRSSGETGTDMIRLYEDIGAVAKALEAQAGNILLTTGSKELSVYRENASKELFSRTFVRVLPTAESLEKCHAAGVDCRRIIAAVGPFSAEMNAATIRQYGIRHLVTKESGHEGGFEEKIDAVRKTGIFCHVITRPVKEEGVSVEEAFRIVTGRAFSDGSVSVDSLTGKERSDRNLHIILAGYGPGGEHLVTPEVRSAIAEADAVFGAVRLLRGAFGMGELAGAQHVPKKFEMYLAEDIIPILETDPTIRSVVILFSGDSGFYSGAAKMRSDLRKWNRDAEINVLPGISSISFLAARLGVSWQDAALFSLHGRKTPKTLHEMIEKIRYTRDTFVLVSGDEDIRDLGRELVRSGIDCEIRLGINLSYPGEKIVTLRPEEAAVFQSDGSIVAYLFHEAYGRRPVMNVLRDEAFTRGKIPMTKETVRHLCLMELGIRQGDTVYDIGGGTGSVAIEAAMPAPSVSVYIFEKRKEACDLIRANREKLRADNVTLVEGEVPESLNGIPDPDCVFIGGSGGRLREIVETLKNRKRGIRYVINAVTLETMEEIRHILTEQGAEDVRIMQISVSTADPTGNYHLLRAQNPVMIYSFVL